MEVKLDDVAFTYKERTIIGEEILRRINLTFEANKINALIGPNGSGKTTMLELIMGLSTPSKGRVLVGEYTILPNTKLKNIKSLHKQIGYIPQMPDDQFFTSRVYDEIAFSLKEFKYKLDILDKRIKDSLRLVNLNEEYLEKDPYHLSLSEKRKVLIAIALAFNPKLLILDEPTVGLDSKDKKNLIKLLIKLKERYNKTIIIASNDTDTIFRFADNIFILNDGKIISSGDKMQVLTNVAFLKEHNIKVPKIIEFSYIVKEKRKIDIGYYNDIKELMKAVYRNIK